MITNINLLSFKSQLSPKKNDNNISNVFGFNVNASKLAPLKKDTISFTSSGSLNRTLMEAFKNESICTEVYENADVAADNLRRILRESLSPFLASDKNPDGIIQRVITRIKSPDSIREKAAGKLGHAITSDLKNVFNPNKADDIKRVCGDIIGARIILRKSDFEGTSKIINALIEKVKSGELKITKIENYVPSKVPVKWEYFRKEDLQRLCDAVNETSKKPPIEIIEQEKETGYMALHLDVDLSNSDYKSKNDKYKGEIQIIGHDVANLKDVEDFCYKLKDHKGIRSGNIAYAPFATYFSELLRSDKYPNVEKNFTEYTRKAFLFQRKKEPVSQSHRKRKDNSLPTLAECGMEGKLPQGLDFNNLAEIKTHCDKLYELTSNV